MEARSWTPGSGWEDMLTRIVEDLAKAERVVGLSSALSDLEGIASEESNQCAAVSVMGTQLLLGHPTEAFSGVEWSISDDKFDECLLGVFIFVELFINGASCNATRTA